MAVDGNGGGAEPVPFQTPAGDGPAAGGQAVAPQAPAEPAGTAELTGLVGIRLRRAQEAQALLLAEPTGKRGVDGLDDEAFENLLARLTPAAGGDDDSKGKGSRE